MQSFHSFPLTQQCSHLHEAEGFTGRSSKQVIGGLLTWLLQKFKARNKQHNGRGHHVLIFLNAAN